MRNCYRHLLLIAICWLGSGPFTMVTAEIKPFIPSSDTVKKPSGTSIVPEHFLRRWDPVTLFFNSDTGPEKPGPEDHPERYVKLSPMHPGAYTWINSRTLQFRPAEPWPALGRFHWRLGDKTHSLVTLMEAPSATEPGDNADNLLPIDKFSLSFKEPISVNALARMIRIELRRLPGVESKDSRWLDAEDFSIKVMERRRRSDPANYVLILKEAIPGATQAIIHLRLSLDDSVEQSFKHIRFATAAPFRVKTFGCSGIRYPGALGGVSYSRDQSIRCNAGNRSVEVEFSSPIASVSPIAARNLVRFTPAVMDLSYQSYNSTLSISGKFESDTLYQLNLVDTPIKDSSGRPLQLSGKHQLYFHFPAQAPFLNWESKQGIIERYGPQMVPLHGRGYDRLDLRIYPVDALNRSFWPFPDQAIVVNESERPPGPGEQAAAFSEPQRHIYANELVRQIQSLGSPAISEIVSLPLRSKGKPAKFGLDLKKYLARINGKNKPGSYLIGIRRLDDLSSRAWIRIQVTDLSLTAIEEVDTVHFVVTSINTGKPVANAKIQLQGNVGNKWTTIGKGHTDDNGAFHWRVPGHTGFTSKTIRRVVVSKAGDSLVLNPERGPEQYANSQWTTQRENWLYWTTQNIQYREPKVENLCHLFSERPVYKPEDKVHLKAYLRQRHKNRLKMLRDDGVWVINGPGDREWRYPLTLTRHGSGYQLFNEQDLPSGLYTAHLQLKHHGSCGSVSFKKEAYRLPRFEVQLSSPDIVSLDQAFKVDLTARYYAGGQVQQRPVRWRVTQFPYTWTPGKLEGFRYSSDGRFSGREPFRATPLIQREGETDKDGATQINLDPTIEPTAQPRSYVVEATVTGADDQTISATRRVLALPPMVLGLKAPNYIKKATALNPQIVVVGAKGDLIEGQEVSVKLSKREWHSHLQAGDFSQGSAKYVTEVVDEVVSETTVLSQSKPLTLKLPLSGAGVYIIELQAHDRLGRAQVVSADFYAAGDEAVTWSRPPTKVFKVTPDQASYVPGDVAHLVLESPFQKARALAIVETPQGNRYHWLKVSKGSATFDLPIGKGFVPRLPVHFVLMRGRSSKPTPQLDLGKPATLAATTWISVKPVENRIEVSLDHSLKAQPGDEFDIHIKLKTPDGKPLSGEATLWLVDQAVLALGTEQEIDPLPDFITAMPTRMTLRDTRNMVLGYLPFQEQPGGDVPARMSLAQSKLMDKVSVRRNFKTVPFYDPNIKIGSTGEAKVHIKLPDNLTVFKIRAKVVSGAERFGYAKSEVSVRLPVIVQPTLPRFVRPGDQFVAQAIGRIVEGDGGAGLAQIKVNGLQLNSDAQQRFDWEPGTPQKLRFKVQVPTPTYNSNGTPSNDSVSVTAAVERSSDKARDAFEVSLPIRPDRKPVIKREIKQLISGKALELPAIAEATRQGSLRRALLVSDQPGLIRMAAGLNYLMEYPHGCTEQRISRARAFLSLGHFRDVLFKSQSDRELKTVVNNTLDYISEVVNDNGLASYWPGSEGYVSLTAWAVQFMIEARNAGYNVDDKVFDSMISALRQALRSDYRHFITGEAYTERSMALWALAESERIDANYAAELARKADYLNLESTAQVTRVLYKMGNAKGMTKELQQRLWNGLVFQLYQGKEVYGGLQQTASSRNRLVLPSETRTLAELLRTLQLTQQDPKRVQMMVDALVTLGRGDGWGNTNATVSALMALSEYLQATDSDNKASGNAQQIEVSLDGQSQTIRISDQQRVASLFGTTADAGRVLLKAANYQSPRPIALSSEVRYLPKADGSQVAALAQGFAVQREWLKLIAADQPLKHQVIDKAGQQLSLQIGDIIEEHVEVVNVEDRTYVAVVVPLAAGMEPMNPQLATAPAEAKPQGILTLTPSYANYADDQVVFYYDSLPKGNYHFYFRTRASIEGSFIQPPAYAELMYEQAVNGNSAGAKVTVQAKSASTTP